MVSRESLFEGQGPICTLGDCNDENDCKFGICDIFVKSWYITAKYLKLADSGKLNPNILRLFPLSFSSLKVFVFKTLET